ncbi:hypothetical protein SDC9_109209 [bioreactor metagenome]|uniref:Uncharacterized protein n=1 Tax=bioreactor metagenome TaxID=1076179 RepID=A0A645BGK5_9ZZZZ
MYKNPAHEGIYRSDSGGLRRSEDTAVYTSQDYERIEQRPLCIANGPPLLFCGEMFVRSGPSLLFTIKIAERDQYAAYQKPGDKPSHKEAAYRGACAGAVNDHRNTWRYYDSDRAGRRYKRKRE